MFTTRLDQVLFGICLLISGTAIQLLYPDFKTSQALFQVAITPDTLLFLDFSTGFF